MSILIFLFFDAARSASFFFVWCMNFYTNQLRIYISVVCSANNILKSVLKNIENTLKSVKNYAILLLKSVSWEVYNRAF